MSGFRAGAMLTQRSAVLRLTGYSTGWQLAARRPPRQQRLALPIRAAASQPAEGAKQESDAPAQPELGVKARLFKLLGPVEDPITSEELWPLASAEGLKSKHFMKSLLNDLRMKGKLTTKPARGKAFGYILPEKWTALKRQAKKAAATDASKTKQARDAVKEKIAAKNRVTQ